MDDLVTRLRRYRKFAHHPPVCDEAASEIERLRARNQGLVEQLSELKAYSLRQMTIY